VVSWVVVTAAGRKLDLEQRWNVVMENGSGRGHQCFYDAMVDTSCRLPACHNAAQLLNLVSHRLQGRPNTETILVF